MHSSGKQELQSLLDVGRLGVKQGSESLELRGKIAGRVFHASPRVGDSIPYNEGRLPKVPKGRFGRTKQATDTLLSAVLSETRPRIAELARSQITADLLLRPSFKFRSIQ